MRTLPLRKICATTTFSESHGRWNSYLKDPAEKNLWFTPCFGNLDRSSASSKQSTSECINSGKHFFSWSSLKLYKDFWILPFSRRRFKRPDRRGPSFTSGIVKSSPFFFGSSMGNGSSTITRFLNELRFIVFDIAGTLNTHLVIDLDLPILWWNLITSKSMRYGRLLNNSTAQSCTVASSKCFCILVSLR